MVRSVTLAVALCGLAACSTFGLGTEKISGDENQVVLSSPDQEKARQHCASFGKDAVNLGTQDGRTTYACRPRRTG